MKKVLIFYWYVPPIFWYPIYGVHLKNLLLYRDRFDEIKFFVAHDDNDEAADRMITTLRYILPGAECIKIANDKDARESALFYTEIVNKLDQYDENTAIFFAHNKGAYTLYVSERDVFNWVNGMYFLDLIDTDAINELLEDENTCCIGSGKIESRPPCFGNMCKYRWHFSGTFFWLVPSRIKKYLDEHKVNFPAKPGRWDTEGFLGEIFPKDSPHCVAMNGVKKAENWLTYIKRNGSQEMVDCYEELYGIF